MAEQTQTGQSRINGGETADSAATTTQDPRTRRLAQLDAGLAEIFSQKGAQAEGLTVAIRSAFTTMEESLNSFATAKAALLRVTDYEGYREWIAQYRPAGSLVGKQSSFDAMEAIKEIARVHIPGKLEKSPIGDPLRELWNKNLADFNEINTILNAYFRLIEKQNAAWIYPGELQRQSMHVGIVESFDAALGVGTIRTGVNSTAVFKKEGASECYYCGDWHELKFDPAVKIPALGELVIFRPESHDPEGKFASAWCNVINFRSPQYCSFSTAQDFAKELAYLLPNLKFQSAADMARPVGDLSDAIRFDLSNVFEDAVQQMSLNASTVDATGRVRNLFNEGIGLVVNIEQLRNTYFQASPGDSREAIQGRSMDIWRELMKCREKLDDTIGAECKIIKKDYISFHDAFDHLKRAANLLLHVMDVQAPKRTIS